MIVIGVTPPTIHDFQVKVFSNIRYVKNQSLQTEINIIGYSGKVCTLSRTETHGCCIPSTWHEGRLLISLSRISINVVLYKRISDFLTANRIFCCKHSTIRTKSCQSNGMVTEFHFLPSVITNQFLATEIPFCINRSRG